VIGTIQATEAIKLLTGIGEPLIGRLLLFDALAMSMRQLKLKKNDDCAICGSHPTVTALIDYEGFCAPKMKDELTPEEVPSDALLIDVREPYEWQGGHIEGARHIPMRAVPQQLDSIPRDREVVVYCQHGQRSAHVLDFLRAQGFTRARHLKGGYVAWLRSGR
jgi:adenylyltransferase/sulfurtransferase